MLKVMVSIYYNCTIEYYEKYLKIFLENIKKIIGDNLIN